MAERHETPELASSAIASLGHSTPIPGNVTPMLTPLCGNVSSAWDPSSRTPGNITPMPAPISGAISSAWDPSSRTPVSMELQSPTWNSTYNEPSSSHQRSELGSEPTEAAEEIPEWLGDPRLQGCRIKLRMRGKPAHKHFEMKSMAENVVTLKDGFSTLEVPLRDILPYRPQRREDVVVCLAEGDLFRRKFRLKSVNPQECVLRQYGVKIQKNEKLFTVQTSLLNVIFPPVTSHI